MRLVESLVFGAEFLLLNLFLISILEDPIQKLIMGAFTVCIIIGAIGCAIVQSRSPQGSSSINS